MVSKSRLIYLSIETITITLSVSPLYERGGRLVCHCLLVSLLLLLLSLEWREIFQLLIEQIQSPPPVGDTWTSRHCFLLWEIYIVILQPTINYSRNMSMSTNKSSNKENISRKRIQSNTDGTAITTFLYPSNPISISGTDSLCHTNYGFRKFPLTGLLWQQKGPWGRRIGLDIGQAADTFLLKPQLKG